MVQCVLCNFYDDLVTAGLLIGCGRSSRVLFVEAKMVLQVLFIARTTFCY